MLNLRILLIAAALVLVQGAAPAQAMGPHSGPAMNYTTVDESLATGGHFVNDGLSELVEDGLEVVIDLRPEDPADRRARTQSAGLKYVHVPVSWEDPQLADFDKVSKAIAAHRGHKLLVQCAANYRASAMTYLHRTLVEGVPEADARREMEAAWKPNRRWRNYIKQVIAAHERLAD